MNLRTNVLGSTTEILAHPESCKGHFTPERWEKFKKDIEFFRVKQGLVTGVVVNDTPPAETITVVESTRQHLGYNAGVEVSVRLYKALGIGGIVRYSKADVPFSPAPGVDVTIKAGGVQAGAGLHFRF